jgi:excisionase family DNA binding protein
MIYGVQSGLMGNAAGTEGRLDMGDSQRETSISTENGTQIAREILGVKGAAKILGCSASHVSNILNGKVGGVPPIPHVRAGRLRLIRREALMRWFEDQERASQEVAGQ